MSSVMSLAGSPSRQSRSTVLLSAISARLRPHGVRIEAMGLRDIPSDDLIAGRHNSQAARVFSSRLDNTDALILATPVYKASFSGGLKAMLDLLPEDALEGKIVLPVATGGSLAHLLAVEYALKPVLSALGARHILAAVFAHEAQVTLPAEECGEPEIDAEVDQRIDDAVAQLVDVLSHVDARRAGTAIPLSALAARGRCSV